MLEVQLRKEGRAEHSVPSGSRKEPGVFGELEGGLWEEGIESQGLSEAGRGPIRPSYLL